MFSDLRSASDRRDFPSFLPATAAFAVLATVLSGCSADVTRFDGAFGLTESPAASHASTRRDVFRPIVNEAALSNSGGSYDAPPPASGSRSDRGGISVSSLPDTPRVPASGSYNPPPAPGPAYAPPPPPPSAPRAVAPVAPSATRVASAGHTIEVQSGDTISGLARKHNVSISELMAANNLRSPAIKPGQQLVLPGGARRAPLAREAAAPAPVRPVAAAASAPSNPPVTKHEWTGSYTVKPGDNPYAIARQHGVKPEELQKANGITDVHKVRPGTVLKVPGAGAAASPTEAALAPERERHTAPLRSSPRAPEAASAADAVVGHEPARPRVINGGDKTQVAAARESVTDASPLDAAPSEPVNSAPASPKAGGPNKLRWPVRGKVIAGFGRLTDGTHNDGVNIQVPAGTDVLAAEAGVVAYAGNEVKGYGNLVLVRHDNGWVTAYAHNDTLLVQRGDRVRRGQAVGKVGKTGSVDAPQLHFELRQGSKPVDPTPYMEKL